MEPYAPFDAVELRATPCQIHEIPYEFYTDDLRVGKHPRQNHARGAAASAEVQHLPAAKILVSNVAEEIPAKMVLNVLWVLISHDLVA